MLNNFGLCSGHFGYHSYLDPIYILGRLFIFLFKWWLTLLQVLTCLLWAVFLTSVQFSKLLQCHLDLSSMCVIHFPSGIWAVIYFKEQISKLLACCLGLGLQWATQRWAHILTCHFVVYPSWAPSLCNLSISYSLRSSFVVPSQKFRTLVPLLCCTLSVTLQTQASEVQREKEAIGIPPLVLGTTALLHRGQCWSPFSIFDLYGYKQVLLINV